MELSCYVDWHVHFNADKLLVSAFEELVSYKIKKYLLNFTQI